MARPVVDLADLLTASGAAMAAANVRLAAAGAPALLREFSLALRLDASFQVPEGQGTLKLNGVSRRDQQMQALFREQESNVVVEATYIAAPALTPVLPACEVADP